MLGPPYSADISFVFQSLSFLEVTSVCSRKWAAVAADLLPEKALKIKHEFKNVHCCLNYVG